MSILVSPSLLAADFANLQTSLSKIPSAPWLHIDVMDGHFVPNLTIGVPVVSSLRKVDSRFFDVHLMVTDPLFYADAFLDAGADLFCFHLESDSDPDAVIELVRGRGRKVGIALKPGTPAEAVLPYLAKVDMVLVMTVEPGFGGQAFMPDMCPKLTALRQAADKVNPGLLLQVDGGISDKTAPLCVEAGANVLVAGSYVFGHADPDGAVRLLAELH